MEEVGEPDFGPCIDKNFATVELMLIFLLTENGEAFMLELGFNLDYLSSKRNLH